MWKKIVRDYFTFNKRERNGLIVLLIFMSVVACWPAIFKRLHKDTPVDFSAFQRAIDSFRNSVEGSSLTEHDPDPEVADLDLLEHDAKAKLLEHVDGSPSLFPFNPNLIDENGWRRLGVPDKTIRTILKYRAKGGKFSKKEDLKKIYGFSESDFQRLEPYVLFSAETAVVKHDSAVSDNVVTKVSNPVTELNAADSLQLISLRGVGPVLSSRIIKYRNKLGGYYSPEQLKEIYGLSPETFGLISSQISIDASAVRKLDINTIAVDDLKQHPYFRYTLASMIVNYRNQHGNFKSGEELRNVELITDSIFQKIEPYLRF